MRSFAFSSPEQARELDIRPRRQSCWSRLPATPLLQWPRLRRWCASALSKDSHHARAGSDYEILADDAYFDCVRIAAAMRPPKASSSLSASQPTEPATGYGYIEVGKQLPAGARTVARFVEKPPLAKAEEMLAAGGFYWNSGIFMFPVSRTALRNAGLLAPDVLKAAARRFAKAERRDLDFTRLDMPNTLQRAPNISIDYAVMEKTSKAVVVPSRLQVVRHGQLGCGMENWQFRMKTVTSRPPTRLLSTPSNSLVMTHGVHLAVQGMDDVAVIASEDAVYVGPLQDEPGRRQARQAAAAGPKTSQLTETHPTSYRPWGGYTSVFNGDRFQVKRIFVTPGKKLSLQKHHHRSEHWIVVKGTAEVTIGGQRADAARKRVGLYSAR